MEIPIEEVLRELQTTILSMQRKLDEASEGVNFVWRYVNSVDPDKELADYPRI